MVWVIVWNQCLVRDLGGLHWLGSLTQIHVDIRVTTANGMTRWALRVSENIKRVGLSVGWWALGHWAPHLFSHSTAAFFFFVFFFFSLSLLSGSDGKYWMGMVRHRRDSIGCPLSDWICKDGGRLSYATPPSGRCFPRRRMLFHIGSGASQPLDNDVTYCMNFLFVWPRPKNVTLP